MKAIYSILLAAGVISLSSFDSSAGSAIGPSNQNQILFGLGRNSPSGSPLPIGPKTYQTDVLLFVGDGTWGAEIGSLENILTSNHASFQEITSAQLDSMALSDITQYGLMIFPGGTGSTQADSLSTATHANLRAAVQEQGTNYLGFCAGSFIAVAPAPAPGQDVSYGIGVVDGPILDYYYLENQGTDIAMTLEALPNGSTMDILWYGGPVTPGGTGQIIAKYPDGTPAISQVWSGKGFVVLSGIHPTATQDTLNSLGVSSSDGLHLDFAWDLISAALHQQAMQAF